MNDFEPMVEMLCDIFFQNNGFLDDEWSVYGNLLVETAQYELETGIVGLSCNASYVGCSWDDECDSLNCLGHLYRLDLHDEAGPVAYVEFSAYGEPMDEWVAG